MRYPLLFLASAALLLSACTPSTVSLDYLPNYAANVRGPSIFQAGEFVDQRGVPPTYLGGIGIRNVVNVENIYLKVPVSESVRNAVLHALDARKMLSRGQPHYVLSGEVLDLRCELLKNPYAYVQLRVKMTDVNTGRVVFVREFEGERQAATFIPGVGDPVPILRNLTSRALQDAVDKVVDDPEMRRVMRGEH
jgi:hypothetical protein